ncbi:hypothetical protein C922_03111 [Plasmodium inui San Antonio 1]|uniref:Uncharacterized protein n=1 Tax=Plasmodium inui San Antonio 1 TaxID=1237626 RepID=W6ZZW7_9APIC|nr:hypothetical protein C922_03111 [Plasmodium inui San Antonio 1]EUD66477.1 hypothetical protein C922_03111 [Plasmodium inui San Antonio 1]
MKLYLLLLNCLIFGNLRGAQSRNIPYKEDAGGVSEEAIKKLKEIKKLELDILKDIVKQDPTHEDIYKKYHCIASDYISHVPKGSNPKETNPNNDPKENKTEEHNLEKKEEKSEKSFIEKIVSFVSIFRYDNVSRIYSENVQRSFPTPRDETDNGNNADDAIYKEDKTEIGKQKNSSSYVQLSALSLMKRNMFLGGKDKSSEHFEVGNLGSFYMIFGARNTDYPWACTCDPLQLIDYKEKKRNYVLCSNQVDMSIQNADLFCNPKNSSGYFYLSYIFMFLIVIVCF